MRRALAHHFALNLGTNPIYETLSQRLERVLKEHNKTQQLKELEALVKDVVQVEEKAKEIGLSNEEYAILNIVKNYAKLPDKEVISFIKDSLPVAKKKTFEGWQRKTKAINEVEQDVFDKAYARFSKSLRPRDIVRLSDEIMRVFVKYNP